MQFKRLTLLSLSALAIFFFAIGSCSKSNNNSSGGGFSATVGTNGFSPSTIAGFYFRSEDEFTATGYSVASGDTTGMGIFFDSGDPIGKAFTNDNGDATIDYQSGSKIYTAGLGQGSATMTITTRDTVNHKIAGTFSGTLYSPTNQDSIKVTNGTFNISYTVEP